MAQSLTTSVINFRIDNVFNSFFPRAWSGKWIWFSKLNEAFYLTRAMGQSLSLSPPLPALQSQNYTIPELIHHQKLWERLKSVNLYDTAWKKQTLLSNAVCVRTLCSQIKEALAVVAKPNRSCAAGKETQWQVAAKSDASPFFHVHSGQRHQTAFCYSLNSNSDMVLRNSGWKSSLYPYTVIQCKNQTEATLFRSQRLRSVKRRLITYLRDQQVVSCFSWLIRLGREGIIHYLNTLDFRYSGYNLWSCRWLEFLRSSGM